MKVVIINKSDSTGGAAVVSRRLMYALRDEGIDARMLVCEKLTDSPFVELAASTSVIKRKFLIERLRIFIANGFNRTTLFKIDTGAEGLPLWRHPMVKDADAILLNWVNQGMLSLKGVKKILGLKKPVIWTMHDMWEMTGICHHAATCVHYRKKCGNCPLLLKKASPSDLSFKIWNRKNKIYTDSVLSKRLTFVAVSHWLKGKAQESSLLQKQKIRVIPNAFELKNFESSISRECQATENDGKIRILFGAARIDDPIKGLTDLKEASGYLKEKYPATSAQLELVFFGNVKDSDCLKGFSLPVKYLGVLQGEQQIREAYESSQIVVSASSYETLPGTLVEAQAYGCIPVSFNRGGQGDIVDHLKTGYLAQYSEDIKERAMNLGEGILYAVSIIRDPERHRQMRGLMKGNVVNKFSYNSVARQYISLIENL